VSNLLLVEDNTDVREITALLLRDSGYDVVETAGGSAALAVLDVDPTIELLIIDFAMPEMSGGRILELARAKRPGIKAVFITGYADSPQFREEFADEIVVQKPFTTDQLVLAVRTALAKSSKI